jgi:uncharacterized protein with PQ loop repeat
MFKNFLKSNIFFVGLAATLIGILSFLPVLLYVHKTREANDFPYITLYIALLSNLLWIVYGIIKGAYASIVQGILYFFIYAYILFVKFMN